MKKTVVYARYSSSSQTEQSIEGQLHVCKDFADSNDYTIMNTYIDCAVTGTNDNRDAFRQMIAESEKKNFDYVLVYKLDRFARNRADSIINKSILKKNGIRVISVTEPISSNPEGIILESVLEGMAEYYSVELSQKLKRGMRESRAKGLYTGGLVLYGYKIVNQKYQLHETESLIVRRIFNECHQGLKINDITKRLNDEGIQIHNKPVRAGRISYILHNPKYYGKCVIAGVEYPNMVPPIIEEDLFYDIQERLSKDKHKNAHFKMKDTPFILSGKLYCGECGLPYIGSGGTSKTGKIYHYYKCSKKVKNTKNCDNIVLKKDEIEDYVAKSLLDKLRNKDIYESIVNHTIQLYNQEIEDNIDLKIIKNSLMDIEKKLNNFALAISEGIFNEKTQEVMQQLLSNKRSLEEEYAIQEMLSEKPITREDVEKYLNKFFTCNKDDIESRRKLFEIFLERVTIYKNGDIIIICKSQTKKLKRKNTTSSESEFNLKTNSSTILKA